MINVSQLNKYVTQTLLIFLTILFTCLLNIFIEYLILNKHYAIALILPALLGSIPIFLLYKRHKTIIKLVYDSVLFWTASVLMLKYVIYTFPKIVENMLSILSKGTIHDNFFDILFTNRAGYSLLITLSMCALAKALATSSDLYDEVIKIIVVKKNINRERLINEKIKKYLW